MKKVLVCLLIINLFSCESEMEKNIMTQKQMSDFLFDVNLINASRAINGNNPLANTMRFTLTFDFGQMQNVE